MTAVVSRRATATTTTSDDDDDNLENGRIESPNTSKHLKEEDVTKKVKQRQTFRNRLYYVHLTWIVPRWKLKLARIAFAMYPYLIMFEKGFPGKSALLSYEWDAYELTKLFSRMAAYIMYPDLLLIFLSKCRAIESFLDKTPLSLYFPSDLHQMHVTSGKWIFLCSFLHVCIQLASWGVGGKLKKIYSGNTGISGLVMCFCLPLIVLPMAIRYLRINIRYEIRKGLHYMFIPFVIALAFHVLPEELPVKGWIGISITIVLCIYIVDLLSTWMFMSTLVETSNFQILPSGCQLTVSVPTSFGSRRQHGGYVYVCLPWLEGNQWHAYSLYETSNLDEKVIFIMNNGDWTNNLHKQLQRTSNRPVWLCGPFTSPYNSDIMHDNLILVAGGIGLTPALSSISNLGQTRTVNLVWMTRDQSMIEFFFSRLSEATNINVLIFYTGQEDLSSLLYLQAQQAGNIKFRIGRPRLEGLIPSIIYAVETGSSHNLPTDLYGMRKRRLALRRLISKVTELEQAKATDDVILLEVAELSKRKGFQLMPLIDKVKASLSSEGWEFDEDDMDDKDILGQLRGLRSKLVEDEEGGSRMNTFGTIDISGTFNTMPSFGASMQSNTDKSNVMSSLILFEDEDKAKAYVKALDKKRILDTWGILYCGGSKSIEDILESVSFEFGIKLNSESFEW